MMELCRSKVKCLNGVRSLCGRIFYFVRLRRKDMDHQENIYEPPKVQLLLFHAQDVLTASGPNTELGPDIGEWDNEM